MWGAWNWRLNFNEFFRLLFWWGKIAAIAHTYRPGLQRAQFLEERGRDWK